MIILFDVQLEYKFNILLLVIILYIVLYSIMYNYTILLLNFYCYCYNEKNIFMFFLI